MRKRLKFLKDCPLSTGAIIQKDTIIDIIGTNIFIYDKLGQGGQVLDSRTYNTLFDFIEDEVRKPNFLKEIPIPYNKC
jgi:hypothetical protein